VYFLTLKLVGNSVVFCQFKASNLHSCFILTIGISHYVRDVWNAVSSLLDLGSIPQSKFAIWNKLHKRTHLGHLHWRVSVIELEICIFCWHCLVTATSFCLSFNSREYHHYSQLSLSARATRGIAWLLLVQRVWTSICHMLVLCYSKWLNLS